MIKPKKLFNKKYFTKGLSLGMAFTFMISTAACGKSNVVVEDYNTQPGLVSDEVDNNSETDAANAVSTATTSGGLREIFGEEIFDNETYGMGDVSVNFNLIYDVPDAEQINTYEGSLLDNNSDIEAEVVKNFFGGTEKNLEEIRYENESEYIPLLYRYRSILMYQETGSYSPADSSEVFDEYLSSIDSSFDKVYKWADEDSYYIHMYEGEYNGTRYGMLYSYDKVNYKRDIYICPISIDEYFPEDIANTLLVVDQKDDYELDNQCTMTESEIMSDANGVLEKLGLNQDNVKLSFNPYLDTQYESVSPIVMSYNDNGEKESYTQMPKLLFSDSDMISTAMKCNSINPAGRTYSYDILRGQEEMEANQSVSNEVTLTENGYAIYLSALPFSENVTPLWLSTFNRGSIYYTEKGLYTVDISLIAQVENVTENVQLLSFDKIKESYKESLAANPKISGKSNGSINVLGLYFTYVLIEDEDNSGKVTYVPAWVFTAKDEQLKDGEMPVIYTSIINALDGSDLTETALK